MSGEELSAEQQQALSEMATAVAQQFAAGRSQSQVVEDLCEHGWPADNARDFVDQIHRPWQEYAASPEGQAALAQGPAIDLGEHFPEMNPIGSSPSLFTLNGFGLGIYGARDHDDSTGSYVKTHCACALFIPVLALGAYRVIKPPEEQGWYFLGKVPLSPVAKSWNLILVLSIVAAIGLGVWGAHTNSPEYRAQQKLKQAEQAEQEGKLAEAARLYDEVVQSRTSHAATGTQKLAGILDGQPLSDSPAETAADVLTIAARLQRSQGGLPQTFDRGLELVEKHAAASPEVATRMLQTISPLSPERTAQAILKLIQQQFAELGPGEMMALFRIAAEMRVVDAEVRGQLFAAGLQRVQRIAATDLKAAVALLGTIAPLSEPPAVAVELDDLLGEPLDGVACTEAAEVLGAARKLTTGSEGRLLQRGFNWLAAHPDAPPRDALNLLQQFTEPPPQLEEELAALRRQLLEQLVAQDPNDLDAATELALLLEADDETERIVEVLEPHRTKLGDSEAARLLGQSLARQENFDDSYELLEPYVESRLAALHAAEKDFEQSMEQAQNAALSQLRMGMGVGFNFNRFENAGDEEKQAMLAAYLNTRMKSDPQIAKAREELVRHAAIVPVALDLGMVTLRRAQTMADPEAKRSRLEKAEKTFLAIRGVAGESDQYRLYLGQVYYWLGKHEQGRAVFDELLAGQGRSHKVLMAVASVLYEVGAEREVRALTEEAYNGVDDPQQQQHAAHFRALAATDLDDRVVWLKRCDQSSLHVKAELSNSLGHQSVVRGDKLTAARHYREAIAVYDRLPETGVTLNNGALVYAALYEVTGERDALEQSTRRLQKSVALSPSDGISLSNLSDNLFKLAVQELAGPDLELHRLHSSGNLTALNALITDEASLTDFRLRMRQHEVVAQALQNLDKVMVLSPKRSSSYSLASAYQGYMRNVEALRQLSQRIEAAGLDLTDAVAETLEDYRGEDDPDAKEKWLAGVADAEATVQEFRDANNGPAFVLAVNRLIGRKTNPISQDIPIDADELVRLADEAHQTAPSLASESSLTGALLFRAAETLSRDDAGFAQMTARSRRALGTGYLIAVALGRTDATGQAARRNSDVRQAVELIAEQVSRYPDSRTAWQWAMLRTTHPEAAVQVAEFINGDEATRLLRKIARQLSPVRATAAYNEYWALLAAGEGTAAQAVLQQTAELGVPLPIEGSTPTVE